ncbi:mediator of RNA polymerase II transcription subunit 31 [Sceloporus undulatus]|uniref:mediator of RNA polymerase II transcription subunit 31 n=1 Tax=Sceloporus undulatus TaxID=8520 RepID=UPI001C4C6CD1|nr:mediator of RNA polymerase II transcription subunit 31 [Sceloporus undulatus]
MESEEGGQRLRFQMELEFVQCLANPNYLNFLAQRGYFKDKAFVNYLKYLLYWKEPEYAKYLKYPQCLHMLELLQHEHFRKELVNAQCAKFIDEQQILHWQHYSRKRMRLQQALAEQQPPMQPTQPPPPPPPPPQQPQPPSQQQQQPPMQPMQPQQLQQNSTSVK